VREIRKVPRGVFHPVPNVDSVLVGLKRHSPAPPQSLKTLVQHGFAHRRKALAKSLSLAPNPPESIRDRTRAALEELGHPADARGEALSPAQWRALWEKLCL
jgi:16S rRNA (adenine1518-N6/adenine1519-N6)-dimethyltransferase